MRSPTPLDQIYRAHRIGLETGGRTPWHEGQVEAGWWKMRLVRRGPWVPVRTWLEQDIGDDGELTAPEIIRCTVDGDRRDPLEIWTHFLQHPIAEHEFQYLTALRAWQRVNEPEAWDPYRPVSMTETTIERLL